MFIILKKYIFNKYKEKLIVFNILKYLNVKYAIYIKGRYLNTYICTY